MKLKIAKEFAIDLTAAPFDTMGLRAFTSGMSGAGKSYTQIVFLEKAFASKLQFLFLDVHGEGHVLGALGNDVLVVSERFGIPVVVEAIPVYLEALEQGMSVVIDLKAMFYEDEDAFFGFLLEFLSKFMARWSKIASPILLAFDEAQEVMPQSPPKGIANLFKTVKKIVLGGRKSGVHYLLASQRPALIDKTPISQANVRLFGKMEEEADWNAIKRHVKGFSYEDLKKLRSGEFILSHEGEATLVHIVKRKTVDAGATPSFEPTFTEVQRRDMDEIAREIQVLVKQAQEAKAKAEEEKSSVKKLEKRLQKSKEREVELERKLDMLEFIADKMGAKDTKKRTTKKRVELDPERVYADVKAEFDKDLKELGRRHQKAIREKDKTIEDLEFKVEHIEVARKRLDDLRDALLSIVGGGSEPPTINKAALVEEVTQKVLERAGDGFSTYTVSPLVALKKDWEKEAMVQMQEVIDGLSTLQIKLLSFLLADGKRWSRTALAVRLIGTRHGGQYSNFKRELDGLVNGHLVAEDEGVTPSLDVFVQYYIGDITEEVDHLEQHIAERIRQRQLEVNKE